ncbi:Deg1p-like type II pseudouridylate synthase TruA [Cryptosporidium canis]|uniref:tRNA pseudouridine synthase n=1 Tax=Cryptosporidium canis TaxID=195482 RepID=A0ABQ8P2B2_9CRYT|nr:Deg1p-like type II pseudouridylate synthase TruA [Cryptosporidium canis]KAJ1605777.1 Deg1p-like type II pseudouridylate synthase TruA [Cryptosporidium canis]
MEINHKKRRRELGFDWSTAEFSRFLLRISYIGTNYFGIAFQKDDLVPTIEGELYKALLQLKLIKDIDSCNLVRCGRTDRGVHSAGNYISVNLRVRGRNLEPYNYMNMLNGVLPWDIRVLGYCEVRPDFSARFDCEYRLYKYFFPLNHDRTKLSRFPKISPDQVMLMDAAAKQFLGTHDFRRFCKMDLKNRKNMTYVRTIYEFDVKMVGDSNTFAVATIKGSAFLWHQVRLMMGILFEIGQQRFHPEIITQMLTDLERQSCTDISFQMATELGLVLWDCVFKEYNIESNSASMKTFLDESESLKLKASLYSFIGS